MSKYARPFSGLGLNIKLVIPKRGNPSRKDIFEYYGVKKNSPWKKQVPSIFVLTLSLGFWLYVLT